MNDLITVSFRQQSVFVIEQRGKHYVPIRPIAEALGLDRKAQQDRIKRDPVLSTCGVMMTLQVPGDIQSREIFCLDLDYLNGWLFGIDANRVKPEIRDRVIEYQRECYKVLAAHFSQKKDRRLQEAESANYRHENAYFQRYPVDRQIRQLALLGEPYWYIGRIVGRAAGTVSNAIRRMLHWGFMDATALKIARTGMTSWWHHRRKFANQLTLGL